ncbi:hypothetical protein AZE42_08514 [Rhizopogon vesiculosus]|uniref:Uncharacterized protein n=1 Tax=Rhizopogon vesiculosus TaxID=180088 RepID=A0A1J8Q731_9AGAM|nr:hypothetical protein AZE42_08514 [Rhizopogon vesiculosus]
MSASGGSRITKPSPYFSTLTLHRKILEWAVPEHAWPEDARGDEATQQVYPRLYRGSRL